MRERATNVLDMRTSNALLILNLIRRESISRARIAKITGLSRAGVSIIVDDLVQRGYIKETNISKNGTGRKALELVLESEAAYMIGVHLRRHEFSIGLFNLNGELVYKLTDSFDETLVPVAQIIELGKRILAVVNEQGVDQKKVYGVGICSSGPVDVTEGKIIRASSKWNEVEIVRVLESVVPWKCCLENRSNARAMYEKLYGCCTAYNDFIFLKVDEAVGGAIVYKGEVLNGYNRFGNEFGHMSINHEGRQCECGNVGCLNMYASIPAIIRSFPGLETMSWKEVVDEALNGNVTAIQAIRQEAAYLATGIVNMCNIFEPEVVVLAGEVTYKPSLILALMSEIVNNRRILRNAFKTNIIVAEEADSVYLRSGAAIIIEHMFNGEISFI